MLWFFIYFFELQAFQSPNKALDFTLRDLFTSRLDQHPFILFLLSHKGLLISTPHDLESLVFLKSKNMLVTEIIRALVQSVFEASIYEEHSFLLIHPDVPHIPGGIFCPYQDLAGLREPFAGKRYLYLRIDKTKVGQIPGKRADFSLPGSVCQCIDDMVNRPRISQGLDRSCQKPLVVPFFEHYRLLGLLNAHTFNVLVFDLQNLPG